jgi:predicted PurR-regulated permease PerM
MAPKTRTSPPDAIVGLWTISLAAFIIAALYFGRELLTPIALAALLTFLLSPLVTRLQRWIGRIGAVLLVVALMFTVTIGAGWVLTRQVVDLGNQLPSYKENVRAKIKSVQLPSGGAFSKLSEAFDDLKKDFPGSNGETRTKAAEGIQKLEPRADGAPIPVEVVSQPTPSVLELSRMIIAPVVGPLGTTALVLLLVIFMLLKREDLRNRLIRLIGQGRISATTSAMDDAASRVSRYLVMQLVVNVTYGMAVALGLWLIGVPNAVLWGTLAAVLRFIPYVGPWIAAALPIILSLAVSQDWWTPLFTIGLFLGLELLSNNVMEPWLYGSSTGVSSLALIIAAVFWTYIWGPIGLVMATPITVCLAVMGRHIPRLSFLNILLSDEDALTPAEDCYHRLLRSGGEDELELAEAYLKNHTLTDFYDTMLVPALIAGEKDHHRGLLDKDQVDQLEHAIADLLEELENGLPGIAKAEEA